MLRSRLTGCQDLDNKKTKTNKKKKKHPEASASAPRRRFFTPNLSHPVDLPSRVLFERGPSIIGKQKKNKVVFHERQ